MNDHLTPEQFSALVDGESPAGDLSSARTHLNECLQCANLALDEWLLKTAIAKSGHRFEAPAAFRDRMASLVAREISNQERQNPVARRTASTMLAAWPSRARWTAAALIVLAISGWAILAYRTRSIYPIRAASSAEIAEACDLHIASLSPAQSPQVLSSDRHTVKPWFQGKLPFSFNIPETLPAGTTLDGADLAYLDGHPVAQLLLHIDRHRVSVFVQEKATAAAPGQFVESHAGFQVVGVDTEDLELIAVSDVDSSRLAALATDLKGAQAHR